MSYLPQVDPQQAPDATARQFRQIESAFGALPNMFRTIGNSPAALESMWTSFGALGEGKLDAALGEKIAVLIADMNRCEYCLAAHTLMGQKAGASEAEMSEAQAGRAADPRTKAALTFAAKLVEARAHVSAEDVEAVRNAGFDDGEIAEILAHVALNIFTNYTNVAFAVPLDFPAVSFVSARS